MLEDTKREVREIRAVEAQMRWNMRREEKKEKIMEEKEEIEEIRDWRWKQSAEMKAYVEEKANETKAVELEESKNFQEFKREAKAQGREENLRHITEEYLQDVEAAEWRKEIAQAAMERERELLADRVDHVAEHREIKHVQRQQEKAAVEEERAIEQSLEMAELAKQLAREKEQLLQSLEYQRACQRLPPGRSAGRPAASRRP